MLAEVVDQVSKANGSITLKDFMLWVPVFLTAVGGLLQARKGKKTAEKAASEIATGNGKTAGEYLPAIMDKLHEIQIDNAVRAEKTDGRITALSDIMIEHIELDSTNMQAMIDALDAHVEFTDEEKTRLDRLSGGYVAQLKK